MTDPATAGWIACAAAIAFTIACIVLACGLINDDLEAAQHELELDELWLDGDDWIEAA